LTQRPAERRCAPGGLEEVHKYFRAVTANCASMRAARPLQHIETDRGRETGLPALQLAPPLVDFADQRRNGLAFGSSNIVERLPEFILERDTCPVARNGE